MFSTAWKAATLGRLGLVESVPPGIGARFVAVSPGDRPRVYEGFLDWDIGLLTIGPDEIHYRGEQISLRVPRAAVCAIEVGAAAPGWIRAPRVILRWLGPSREEVISLRPAECRTVSGIGPASRLLGSLLEAWRGDATVLERGDAPAGIGSVTARTPADAAAPRDLIVLVALLALMSAAASFALGLDFWLGLDLFAAALIGVIAVRWPVMTSRERPSAKAAAPESERSAA